MEVLGLNAKMTETFEFTILVHVYIYDYLCCNDSALFSERDLTFKISCLETITSVWHGYPQKQIGGPGDCN
jgi:hypothetical protein